MTFADKKTSRPSKKHHPYLHGNFAPTHRVQSLTPCAFTGILPAELAGGQYVRNGGNPVTNEDLGRDAHWFDGDGMLTGVSFRRLKDGKIQPEYVNQYILTDTYLSTITTPSLRLPILPSISTLVNPASSLLTIILRILRTILLVILSHLPGSKQAIKKISVANTGILYHDGRALATCESGPPIRVSLPGLETIGWFDGQEAEGEPVTGKISGHGFGGDGFFSFMDEWTTAHPRVDPITKDLILFHSTFIAPFVHYSIVPSTYNNPVADPRRLINAKVPGIKSAKMMHDFGVSLTHTVIMDLPLSLDPLNLCRMEPVVSYNASGKSRFGVFPRWSPQKIRWFETNPCCIFHTANTWDEISSMTGETTAINMLACRLTSASLVFSAGNVAAPTPKASKTNMYEEEEEQCRLYYYQFPLSKSESNSSKDLSFPNNEITHQFALSTIPFEFPSLRDSSSMTAASYIYGCSVSTSSFGAALGRAVKIDSLVKMNTSTLISRGITNPPTSISGCVDNRSVAEILAQKEKWKLEQFLGEEIEEDKSIQVFKLPEHHYAQESRFVPRNGGMEEDDGFLLAYVFDERQLDAEGEAPASAASELWVVDARDMETVVAKVKLPQRVPYGLHGGWFSEADVRNQRPVATLRQMPDATRFPQEVDRGKNNILWHSWLGVRNWAHRLLG